VLRSIFGPKWEEVAGGWTSLCNEQLHKCTLQGTVGAIKSMRIRWAENLGKRDHAEDVGGDGRIILEWVLGK